MNSMLTICKIRLPGGELSAWVYDCYGKAHKITHKETGKTVVDLYGFEADLFTKRQRDDMFDLASLIMVDSGAVASRAGVEA